MSYILELSYLLVNKDQKDQKNIQKEVKLSVNKPKEYFSLFASDLAERGIEKPIVELPWFAMINGLYREGFLQELDWKSYPEDFVEATLALIKCHSNSKQIKNQLLDLEFLNNDLEVEEVIIKINKVLQEFNILLIIIDIDSDSYLLNRIEFDKKERVLELVSFLGYGKIKIYRNKKKSRFLLDE